MTLTAAQLAYRQIKESIITTRLPPGAVVEITQQMAELGFGRTPIREALKLLEREQLVIVSPRRGIFVTDVSITDLHQVHEIRMELDPLCASLAVERISRAEIEKMRALVRELDEIESHAGQPALLDLDRRFHTLLAEACHNRLLQGEIEKLYSLSRRIWYICTDQSGYGDVAQGTFREVLGAIEARDAACASHAVRRHILRFYESVKKTL